MKLKRKNIALFTILVITLNIVTCTDIKDDCVSTYSNSPYSHIKYFGFALIDTYWDDPLDDLVKTVYNDEVYEFCNTADILVQNPSDNILTRIQDMNQLQMKPYIHITELFFELVGTSGPSGASYDLRSDYQSRWDTFVLTNSLNTNANLLQAFYLGEEPTWNDISFIELKSASDYIKATIPTVPILVIEAYSAVNDLQIPDSVDWIGFDHYFVQNPQTDTSYQSELSTLKSKFSTINQKLVIVMDTHYISWAHGDYGGITQSEMKCVAVNYFELAKSEPLSIAIIGYTWPGGFGVPEMLGARQLLQSVKDEYVYIGKLISGKP